MKKIITLFSIIIFSFVFSCSSDSEYSVGTYALVKKTGGMYAIYPKSIDINDKDLFFFGFAMKLKMNGKGNYYFTDHQNNRECKKDCVNSHI